MQRAGQDNNPIYCGRTGEHGCGLRDSREVLTRDLGVAEKAIGVTHG